MSDITYLTTWDDLGPIKTWLAEDHGTVSIDVETTDLDYRAHDFAVRQLAVGAADGTGWVMGGHNCDRVREVLIATFAAGPVWAHNADFEAGILRHRYGVKADSLRDTLAASKTAWPGLDSHSLKDLRPATQVAQDVLRSRWSKVIGRDIDPGAKSWLADAVVGLDVDDPALINYVAVDTIETSRLGDALMDEPEPVRAAMRVDLRTDQLWRWVGYDGIVFDSDAARPVLVGVGRDLQAIADAWGTELHKPGNDREAWLDRWGIVPTLNDKGNPSLSKENRPFADVPDHAAEAWEALERACEISTTVNKLNELIESAQHDDKVHPTTRPNGAVTGRMSMSGPALQNIPDSLRPLFFADPGKVLVACDLDRVEPTLLAAVSQDPAMIEAVTTSDVYVEVAVAVWGEEARTDPARRKQAKVVLLALMYGMGARSLSKKIGTSRGEARKVQRRLLKQWPEVRRWIQRRKHAARRGEPLTTHTGRPLPECIEKPYLAVNYAVQGGAADVYKVMVEDVTKRLPAGARTWLPIHDELVVECLPSQTDEVSSILAECMTTEVNGVPITSSPEVLGEQWRHI